MATLSGYDWEEVFKYGQPEVAVPGITTDTSNFDLTNVEEIYASVEGEGDGPDWVAYGKLKDGRYFSIAAGCDYTGWD